MSVPAFGVLLTGTDPCSFFGPPDGGHRRKLWTSSGTHVRCVHQTFLATPQQTTQLVVKSWTQRNPLLLLRLFGLLLLRLATRQLLSLLLNEPPRSTRFRCFEFTPLKKPLPRALACGGGTFAPSPHAQANRGSRLEHATTALLPCGTAELDVSACGDTVLSPRAAATGNRGTHDSRETGWSSCRSAVRGVVQEE